MSKIAHYNNITGLVLGLYDTEIHTTIPTPNISLTDVEWSDFLDNQDTRKVDIALTTMITYVPTVDLAEEQGAAKKQIDGAAETARQRYITSGEGQAMIYQEKASQASAYILAGYPADLTGYPLIQSEVNATSKTATASADDIIVQRDSWIALGAQIEEIRLAGKIAVDAAADVISVASTKDNSVALLDAI